MCVAAAAIPWIAMAVSTAATVYSANAQQQSGKYNEKIAEQNAEIDRRAAIDATQRGADQAALVKEKARHIAASQRAGAAAGGVSADSGSALDLLTETAGMGELDALTTMNNAQRQAYGYNVQASNQLSQGRLARYQGDSQATGTYLTGASRLMSMYGSSSAPAAPAGRN